MDETEAIKLRERIQRVEWGMEKFAERLGEGAVAFAEVRSGLGEMRKELHLAYERFQEATKPRPIQVWKVASFSFTVLCTMIALVWMFARYPDREEFSGKVMSLTEQVNAIRERQTTISTNQTLNISAISRQEKAQERIDSKLDKLLDAQMFSPASSPVIVPPATPNERR